jgi:hypothetical protein
MLIVRVLVDEVGVVAGGGLHAELRAARRRSPEARTVHTEPSMNVVTSARHAAADHARPAVPDWGSAGERVPSSAAAWRGSERRSSAAEGRSSSAERRRAPQPVAPVAVEPEEYERWDGMA